MLTQIWQSVDRIELFPNAAPYAPENEHRPYSIRMTVVAGCRLLFNVDEDTKTVRVIGFSHGRQLPDSEELPELLSALQINGLYSRHNVASHFCYF